MEDFFLPFPSFDDKRHLLAFSGGPDSVFLLFVLKQRYPKDLKRHVELAYVDYHDSPAVPEEERIVHHFAKEWDVPLHRMDIRHEEKDGNFEAWARKIRYDYFRKLVQEEGFGDVLTAHHQDDAIETYLLQKERHSLPRHYGLSPTSDIGGLIVLRPLLGLSKKEIYHFLNEKMIPYFEDPTNHDDHTKRNRIRKTLSEEEKGLLLKEMVEKNESLFILYRRFEEVGERIPFSWYDKLEKEEKERFSFFLLEREEELTPERKEGLAKAIQEFLKGRGNNTLPLEKKAIYRFRDSFFVAEILEAEDYEKRIDSPGIYSFPYFTIDLGDPSLFNHLSFPFIIRNIRNGDVIGTDLVSKDAKTFLRRQKVPFHLRDIYPVFIKDGKIACIPFYLDIQKGILPISFNPFGKKGPSGQ